MCPSREDHRRLSKKLLGKDYDAVHKFLDLGVNLLGPHHRRVTHTQQTALLIGLKYGPEAWLAAQIHMAQDRFDTLFKKAVKGGLRR